MSVARSPLVVVCGATGQQGSWVVRALLRRGGARVVALSRRPGSPAARELLARGVEVRRADLGNVDSLVAALEGAGAVFGVTQPWSSDYARADVAAELAQGRNLVDACRRAGVGQLVFSTAMRVDDAPTGVPHVDSKRELERYLRGSGVPFTLLRPGTFMDNLGRSFFPIRRGTVRGFVPGDVRLPFVACRDIGEACAAVIADRDRWLGATVDLVGEFTSGDELCAALGRLRRERFRHVAPPELLVRAVAHEFFAMRRGMERAGRPPYPYREEIDAAIEATRRLVGAPWSLERFLLESGFDTRSL